MAIAQSRWACACVLLWADGTISHSLSHALRLGTNTAACTKHNQSPSATSMVLLSQLGSRRNLDCPRSFFVPLLCVLVVFRLSPLLFPLVDPHIPTSLLHQLEFSFLLLTYFFFLSIHHSLHHISSLFSLHGPTYSSPLFSSIFLIFPFVSYALPSLIPKFMFLNLNPDNLKLGIITFSC